ncbi:MAG: sulfatase-like hydrolase/transferase, partial [Lentisphaeria bacterium]|nr:sulfatase-like hydrolase/transferase [Lentisphaeria bacterium]
MGCPNLILILTDHFRPDAVGRHTPVLQRLAADGVSFANAYCASPLCQPSRASLVTGLFPSQHGVCGNQSEPIAAAEQADTFMQHLRRAGYATAMIGKHHYLDRYGIGMDVTDDDEAVRAYGFETVCQVVDDGENVHNDDEYTRFLAAGGRLEAFRTACREGAWRCDPHPFGEEDTVDGFIGRRGVEFVRSQPIDRPFYLNLSFVGPHPPYWHPGEGEVDTAGIAPPEGSADSPATRRRRAHYRERCSRIDRCIGRLLAALGERGL